MGISTSTIKSNESQNTDISKQIFNSHRTDIIHHLGFIHDKCKSDVEHMLFNVKLDKRTMTSMCFFDGLKFKNFPEVTFYYKPAGELSDHLHRNIGTLRISLNTSNHMIEARMFSADNSISKVIEQTNYTDNIYLIADWQYFIRKVLAKDCGTNEYDESKKEIIGDGEYYNYILSSYYKSVSENYSFSGIMTKFMSENILCVENFIEISYDPNTHNIQYIGI
jgi:hypothetical protein